MEAAKGVLWSREMVTVGRGDQKKKVHKTVVVLVLLSDEPVNCAATGSDVVVMGQSDDLTEKPKLTDALNGLLKCYRAPRTQGEASDVLCSLDEWRPNEMEACDVDGTLVKSTKPRKPRLPRKK